MKTYVAPSEGDRLTAFCFGAHVAKATQRWIGQAVYPTGRHNEEKWKLTEKERVGTIDIIEAGKVLRN
ncbi:hypothetical protein A4R26_28800 [Niastella populi]|uniref:Uncharacterized protein n=1 Tax=Niastella populi TaxID=550983 RepID=A0A1V9F2F0_9BACT|nr:hypothetical protein A4R26_28800 [Niastella populi]